MPRQFKKRTFAQFVAWLRGTRKRFYGGDASDTCPLATMCGESVGVESDVLIDWPNKPFDLIDAFDAAFPTTGKAALRVLAAKGWIPKPKKRR